MAEDWAIDVKKYAPDADDGVIAAIVRYCGIALQSRDASLVSFTDPVETARVRDNYCKKKLGLTHSDAELDAAIASVGQRMSGDTTRNRVTVYYLLAEMFGKLGLFGGAAAAAMPAAAVPAEPVMAPAPLSPPPVPLAAAPMVAAAAIPAAVAATAPVRPVPPVAEPVEQRRGGIFGTAFGTLATIGVIVLGTAVAGSLIGSCVPDAPVAPAVVAPAPAPVVAAPVAPAIPEGSGVVAQDIAGKPQLSVYFDTAKTDISPDFDAAAAPIKAYVDANPGSRLAVSGFNDPRGDAAFNAELSKNRAQRVAAALAALGIPDGSIDLEKPPETTDTTTSLENARRVDIVVKE